MEVGTVLVLLNLRLISVLIPDESYLLKDVKKNKLLLLWAVQHFFTAYTSKCKHAIEGNMADIESESDTFGVSDSKLKSKAPNSSSAVGSPLNPNISSKFALFTFRPFATH